MVCVITSFCKFFLLFSHKKESSRGEEFQSIAASRVPGREDVLQRYYENSASLLEKLRNKIFRFADLQRLDIFYSNATYVKGLQEK